MLLLLYYYYYIEVTYTTIYYGVAYLDQSRTGLLMATGRLDELLYELGGPL